MRVIALILVFAVRVFPQTAAEGRYQSKLENDVVAVYDIDLPAHASASTFQSAHDTIWLALTDSSVSFALAQPGKVDVQFQTGDVRFFPSFETKLLTNIGSTQFRGVMIAIKARGLASNGCECTGSTGKTVCGCKGATHLDPLWAFSFGEFTLAGTSLGTGEAFRAATLRDDMLLVAVTAVELEDQARADTDDGTPGRLHLRAGEAAWIPSGRHQFKNVGSSDARFVTLEF
jgi:hypothetical protein